MSEINQTPEELTEEISYEVEDANVIPTPIDPTLTHQGESADAYATGQAIANVFNGATVNNKQAVNKAFTIYADDILVSDEQGAQTIAQALENVSDKDASQIMYDSTELVSVKDALDGIYTDLDSELTEEEIDDIFEEVFGGEE